MVSRGTKVFLEPNRYSGHAALQIKFEKIPGWEQVIDPDQPVKFSPEMTEPEQENNGLLPHQLEAIERIKSQS
jgi:hypothetical protein